MSALTAPHPLQPLGGEDILLDEFENLGLRCNPATQLVVTCEVRGRSGLLLQAGAALCGGQSAEADA